MEGRLLGGLRLTSSFFGDQMLVRLSLVFRSTRELDIMYEEHLCTVSLTGSAREFPTHPLAPYFLVRSSTAFRLISGE